LKEINQFINVENDELKAMMFVGCSHTYGHGLWYYSGLKDIPNGDEYLSKVFETKPKFIKYRELTRFARTVSSHFNTYEITKDRTSGNDVDSIHFINESFAHDYKFEDVSYLIFQTSFLDRCPISYQKDNKFFDFRLADFEKDGVISDEAISKLNELGIKSFEEYVEKTKNQVFHKIRDTFIYLEDRGIKCRILSYTEDYIDLIKSDEFMSERFITMNYKDKEYNSILDMIYDGNLELMIINDKDYFGENTPKDYHPSKTCHQIIAKNIIDKLPKETKISLKLADSKSLGAIPFINRRLI